VRKKGVKMEAGGDICSEQSGKEEGDSTTRNEGRRTPRPVGESGSLREVKFPSRPKGSFSLHATESSTKPTNPAGRVRKENQQRERSIPEGGPAEIVEAEGASAWADGNGVGAGGSRGGVDMAYTRPES
jgi:hypothetical protein